jgi:poly(hydroxyalkanoate) depolymerase family esterase
MLSSLRKTWDAPLDHGGARRLRETAKFAPNPGALRMLSYAPEGLDAGAPLVVVLHGCTQDAEGFAATAGWLDLADRCGFAVLAPEQTAQNNPNRCFNWFSPQDAARSKGEAASIRAMVAAAVGMHRSDPARVFVTGLSAGGAMTMVMLAAYPEVFAGGAVVAGLPYGAAKNVQQAMMAMQGHFPATDAELGASLLRAAKKPARTPRLSIWHGDADHMVRPANATAIASQWAIAHGLPEQPDEVSRLPGRRHAIWRSAAGEVVMETHLLEGMGHGVSLSTSGPDGLGAVAPFMLEHGVSSTREIAGSWGIASPADARPAPGQARSAAAPRPEPDMIERPAAGNLAQDVLGVVGRHVSADVQAVIAKAFKSAGLMK